jgi:predicted transport protein
MSGFGLYSEGPKPSVDKHLSRLDEPARSILKEIRAFVLSLGNNVIEEARPHRIVYAKSFNFRTFLDIEPDVNMLNISVKTEPRNTVKITINSTDQLAGLKELIQQGYDRI